MEQGGPVIGAGVEQGGSRTGFRWLPVAVASAKWIPTVASWIPPESSRKPPSCDAQSFVLLNEKALRLAKWIPGGFPGEIA
ncbi:hypothetical protein FQV27_17430 [Paracoccus aurantiacus]|uniref:Uncharacterized protein n=1 Tax=Paracoccus aurantiacus TaxID=2599412 RepID=A0A5C6RS60_9RHOB|nr:hypothetical protein [Paracoccus aurantiacus]TXB64967.1 hypothetical protein FQV27_17430 [Paracoccus aurantiacus]